MAFDSKLFCIIKLVYIIKVVNFRYGWKAKWRKRGLRLCSTELATQAHLDHGTTINLLINATLKISPSALVFYPWFVALQWGSCKGICVLGSKYFAQRFNWPFDKNGQKKLADLGTFLAVSQNPITSRFWFFGFLIFTLSFVQIKRNHPWNIFRSQSMFLILVRINCFWLI